MIRRTLPCIMGVSMTLLLVGCARPHSKTAQSWNPRAAATYLDEREVAWMNWPSAARDHGTFCVSCHTVLPYVLSRPMLRAVAAGQSPSEEGRIFDNVTKRVSLWSQTEPYYKGVGYEDGKPEQSRGTEAVLNALVLASHDAQQGKLNELTLMAFQNMWALQRKQGPEKGSWPWLQFEMEPWEAGDSAYYGAALSAIAVGMAPENYRASPEIQPQLKLLHDYLNGEAAKQSAINRVVLLWAGIKLPGLLDAEQRNAIVDELRKTQRSDGGWELSSLSWPGEWSLHSMIRSRLRSDWSRQGTDSDGYATALITFVLGQSGLSASDPTLSRGLAWLAENQNRDGSWPSVSLTKRRDPSSMPGHFMRDAATAYAVLALAENRVPFKPDSPTPLARFGPTPFAVWGK